MSITHDREDNDKKYTLEQKKKLIAQHPCFGLLFGNDIEELALIAFEKHYSANEVIVTQGDLIDAVYLIATGRIEVAISEGETNTQPVPVAVLREGEAIGLSETGFFAQHGLRTATLTTITEVALIGWNIADFHHFLITHPLLGTSMQQASELMLRMNFIRECVPFTNLPTDKISQLAQEIKEISVSRGTTLIHEGEQGEEIYLIRSGKVEILIKDPEGKQHSLAILEPPQLFGEIALLTSEPRNATAKIIENTNLLVLNKKQIADLLTYHLNTAESLTALTLVRSRPVRVKNISHYHRTTTDGRTIVILKDAEHGRYYQLSPLGWLVWQQLDGRQSIEDITLSIVEKNKIFAPEEITIIIFNLANAGFISFPALDYLSSMVSQDETSLYGKIKNTIFHIIFIRYFFYGIDNVLTKTFNKGINLLFSKAALVLSSIVVIMGIFLFCSMTHDVINTLASINHPYLLLLLLLITNLFLTVFHELGHAYATKASGHDVFYGGIIFFWIGMIVFVDTSDLWLSDRRTRIRVNLTGPYIDLVLAGIASMCALLASSVHTISFFWLLSLILYCNVFRNLNPLYVGDGYFVLTDLLNIRKLRIRALEWLGNLKFKSLFNWQSLKSNYMEVTYWLACIVFLVIAVFFAFIAQGYLRMILPETFLGISTFHLVWLLPGIFIANFLLNVGISLIKYKYRRPGDI